MKPTLAFLYANGNLDLCTLNTFPITIHAIPSKEALKEYPTEHLSYSNSKKLATIPNGDVGGAGEAIDKIYNITYITDIEWAEKQSEIKTLYSS